VFLAITQQKTLFGPTFIADATKSTRAIMTIQMKTISDAFLLVERSKVELQMKFLEEQMSYQRERHQASRDNNSYS